MKAPGWDVDPNQTGRILGWNATTTARALAGVVDVLRTYGAEIRKPLPRSPELPPVRVPIEQHTAPSPYALSTVFAQRNRLGADVGGVSSVAPNPFTQAQPLTARSVRIQDPAAGLAPEKLVITQDPGAQFSQGEMLKAQDPASHTRGASTGAWRDAMLLKAAQSIMSAGRRSAR